ncbi:hypothetical protein Poly30_29340 [Planctomycetes bacterium Poly30]|uniref:FG-GAP repeat protein n=1 Tax=Saltatorellus ferox TaxID=2528018 RepID=A0A518ETK4_9BACT|nr:hypothetical protein Poly30_29340 [Planctomycetes bacterium Poly30]
MKALPLAVAVVAAVPHALAQSVTIERAAGATASRGPVLLSTPVIQERLRFVGADTAAGDNFGFDVWISGDLIAVGAPFADIVTPDVGAAYVFDAVTGLELAKLQAPISSSFFRDGLGSTVVLHGRALYAGAPRHDFLMEPLSGRIYGFEAVSGLALPSIDPVATGNGGTIAHALGETMDVDGGLLVAGSRGDSALQLGGGSAHLFDANTGAFRRKLFPSDPGFADNFGFAVAISGSVVIVGCPFDDDNGTDSGSAYLFDASTGLQLRKLVPVDTGANDLFGARVEIDAGVALVGAPFIDSVGGMADSGAVYVYDVASGARVARWTSPDPGVNHQFGDGLAITQDYLLIGEPLGRNSAGIQSGVIHVYDRSTLALCGRLEASDGADGDGLGESLHTEGSRVVAGARGSDVLGNVSGSAYLFTLP